MKDHTLVLPNMLAKVIPAQAQSSLPMLLALARLRGNNLMEVYGRYARGLLRLTEHAGSGGGRKFLSVLKMKFWVLRLKLISASKEERARAITAWREGLSPVGANPFEACIVYKRWASIDDIDIFGMHLSNSSYAKAFDSTRAKALVQLLPAWGRSGGQMALGATHYHFLREIPPLVRYEVRLSVGSWDHKWLYLVARYVTLPGHRHPTPRSSQSSTPSTTSGAPASTLATQNGSTHVEHAVAAILQAEKAEHINNGTGSNTRATSLVEPDGAILHCVAVSQICFKWGRITVPPAVVLASDGFTKPYGDGDNVHNANTGARSYSHANPPPNWIKSQSIRVPPHGSMDKFRNFLRGNWRDVPEGERWWEDALGGSVEAKRQANLDILESLRLGLEQTRSL